MSSAGRALLALGLFLVLAAPGRAVDDGRFADLGLPAALGRGELESLLQRFVEGAYLKAFRHLGDERDFDHGHVLSDASGRPLAILYHTQELARGEPSGSGFDYVDSEARNWIQWIDGGRVENASRYRRRDYPRTAAWDWFRASELPALDEHRTILDKMLDPALIPVDVSKSKQWVFTRVPCGDARPGTDSKDMRILLPTREVVCLALSAS
ncbi:MAG: hypothetical protein ACHQ49_07540 [Elusimicrobiota bacterium]